jgi:predicted RNA-binding protein YlxR (DUF448 family)
MATKARSGPRPRHVPQRTCIACRTTEAKRGLIRVVRTPEGRVEIDPTGKKNGRGAYVHESRRCWDEALKRERLARSLKVSMGQEDYAQLKAHAEALPADGNETS